MFYYAKEDPDIGFDGLKVSETELNVFPNDGYRYVRIISKDEYYPGATAACYDTEGKLLNIVQCIQSGLMRLPRGKSISSGHLVDDEHLDNDAQEKATKVMFRALAMTDVMAAADALDNAGMFPQWADCIGKRAEAGSYWRYADKLYRVNTGQGHTIQADWSPDKAASLFSLAANPAEEWPEWMQPTGAHNAYVDGNKVTYKGKRYISKIEANVWAPDAYPAGWEVQ